MTITKTLAAFSATLLLSSTVVAAQFYKWTDDQGATHYSEEPPPASVGKASEVKVRTKLPSGSRAAAEAQAAAAATVTGKAKGGDKADTAGTPGKKNEKPADTVPASDTKTPEQYAEKCKTLRANLEAMQAHGRVRETAADGSVRSLSDEEKQKRMDETQRQIKGFCEG